jgi:hypothetical protein
LSGQETDGQGDESGELHVWLLGRVW